MALNLITGPARSGKTQCLLERYRRATEERPGSALWIGPTRRSVMHLRRRMMDAGIGLAAAHTLTLDELASEIIRANDPAARPLAKVHRHLVVARIIYELHAAGRLAYFQRVVDTRGFAAGVLDFLAEMRRHEIHPDQFERASCSQRQGANGDADKLAQCLAIYRTYHERLRRHALYELEGRCSRAADLLSQGLRGTLQAARSIFFDDFVDFTGSEYRLIKKLTQALDAAWLALPDDTESYQTQLFAIPRQTQARLAEVVGIQRDAEPPITSLVGPSSHTPPAGLTHVQRQIFGPLRSIIRSTDASGLLLLEAPGMLGEARMVAREVKQRLVNGMAPDEIVVTMRDVEPYADLLREVFEDYGIPVDLEGIDPLIRNPAVSTLLRALRVPVDGWRFASVGALLRNTYFGPSWAEAQCGSDIAAKAEAMLRMLGVTRGREAFLKSLDYWADTPPKPRDDELPGKSRAHRKHELAKQCRPFLRRFFAAWECLPKRATLAAYTEAMQRFCVEIGIARAAADVPQDVRALERFWRDLERWEELDRSVFGGVRPIDLRELVYILSTLAAESGNARSERGSGRVRVLSAPNARYLGVSCLFVMGLGEGSFPRLTPPEPLLEESQRQALRRAGHCVRCRSDLLPDEMLLFYQVISKAQRELVLSYPAVDERGQPLLPSAFWNAAISCFDGVILKESRSMLVDRYDVGTPFSPAEYRVQVAKNGLRQSNGLDADLAANLKAARRVARARFRNKNFGVYDGLLRQPAVIKELDELVGPRHVFSPTALEDYIACPFRFFLGRVLGLEPMENPTDEIEVTQRGQAVHAAMSQLHKRLSRAGEHCPTENVSALLAQEIDRAVEDWSNPHNPAAEVLWRIEGQRLQKLADTYRSQWEQFLDPWLREHIVPRPTRFESGFGMPPDGDEPAADPLIIENDGVLIKVHGRIDRIDTAETEDGLVLWIIDYKTGRNSYYTSDDVRKMKRVQLLLYALAAEKLVFAGRSARPLGLAYWMLRDGGPKLVRPARKATAWLSNAADWAKTRADLEQWVARCVAQMRQGNFSLAPRSEQCTATCAFAQVCRITQARSIDKPAPPDLPGGD